MYVSPIHIQFPDTVWSFEDRIDIFYHQVDGWHLEIADRNINGWLENQTPCIVATDRQGRDVNYVPDSGWAVLQIAFNYFETIALFKLGENPRDEKENWRNRQLFIVGILDVFEHLEPHRKAVKDILWKQFRIRLYHSFGGSQVFLQRIDSPIEYSDNRFIIDPHLFVPALRKHFVGFYTRLKNPDEIDLREKFKVAYEDRYGQR